MSTFITIHSLQVHALFSAKHLTVQQHAVIGVVGKNGAGKSTLLQLITGDLQPTAGIIDRKLAPNRMHLVHQDLVSFTEQAPANNDFKTWTSWYTSGDFHSLSGGERLKNRLGAAFTSHTDLLLLDEPTNHLDEKSVDLLISTIHTTKPTLVIASHDRYFLDAVATEIWAIADGIITVYAGNYSAYEQQLALQKKTQQKLFEQQQKEQRKVKEQMQKLTNWSASAHAQSTKQEFPKEYYRSKAKQMDKQRKSVEKRLAAKLEKTGVTNSTDDDTVHFVLQADAVKSGTLFELKNTAKHFGEKTLLHPTNGSIPFGTKLAITGANGSGKSTLLNMLLQQVSYDGEIWSSSFANIGYLSQDVFDLPLEKTVKTYFDLQTEDVGPFITMLVQLGFLPEHYTMQLAQLSMGERIKIKLLKLIVEQKNVLILDEPTNHLDLAARQELETVLQHYNGTLIFVSHDRYFRKKIATMTWQLHEGILSESQFISTVDKTNNDLLLLSLQKDQLLSELSFEPFGSDKYWALDAQFKTVLATIKSIEK
ncbi:ribosomal protection-like ABC-F family protein [Kurthia sibirica]|uniref:Elongation factor 3 n=1 Tax=Kurthia sibirica TaxID=202750 RepID=A0A2U3AMJ3_9BACL|nr:ABC-F family ATP-binding cassette domain-containing protein [Kurthia sibirica]PWI25756.1 elongation factor 3 [Kurthia sibirica]GEK35590.1 ABC transporter ATP-binding protein [Kurthia sibirica]